MKSELSVSKSMNKHCLCKTLDRGALENQLKLHLDKKSLQERPHLFSDTAYYISETDLREMESIISAIEDVTKMKSFQDKVKNSAPPIAINDFGPQGVLMGFDFHLTEGGPKLIEINTNAGGAYLNWILAKAQDACCEGINQIVDLDKFEDELFQMFMEEWKLQRGQETLKVIAIIDDSPTEQYLYPEFLLFSELFIKHGIDCVIVDPANLKRVGDKILASGKEVDLIYNRTTDFYFADERYEDLKHAYQKGLVVVTPNPYHHALYANKLNLTTLSDPFALEVLKVDAQKILLLKDGIPSTILMTPENRDELWKQRKKYFFKPLAGFGSKAAYRGDKITLKVWDEISRGDYVAQEIASPGLRSVEVDGDHRDLKIDLRVYTYQGRTLLLTSRLYQGQTTNFRTQGGGFAPVFLI